MLEMPLNHCKHFLKASRPTKPNSIKIATVGTKKILKLIFRGLIGQKWS